MKYKIFVFTDNVFQNVDLDLNSLSRILASFNVTVQMFSIMENNQSSFENALGQGGNLILFCQNQQIDKIIIDNISKLSNDKNIIDEEVVIFKKDGNKIIFVPYDSNWQAMLSKINLNENRANKTCQFKMFGISRTKVLQDMQSLVGQIDDLKFSVIGNELMVELFVSYSGSEDLIDEGQIKIASMFKNYIYSENSLNLSQTLCQLARLKDMKLSICEGITGGALMSEICLNNRGVSQGIVFSKLKFLNKELTADNVYEQTLTMFSGSTDTSFAINVQGEYENDTLTCIYAIGTANSIDVYKNVFKAEKEKAFKFAINAIMFNIVKKMRQNSLEI